MLPHEVVPYEILPQRAAEGDPRTDTATDRPARQLRRGELPSGHVVYITSLCGLLGWFALARGHRATCAVMLLLILAMGPFRVIDGAHWPSDVLAGYALGLAWTIIVLVIGLPWAAGQSATGLTGTNRRSQRIRIGSL